MDIGDLDQALVAFLQSIPKQTKRHKAAGRASASEIEHVIDELRQIWRANAHALFRRIQNQSGITEGDRAELMELASRAVNGGLLIASVQAGGPGGLAKLRKAKSARDGKSKKAAICHAKAEEFGGELWKVNARYIDNAEKTAGQIHADLASFCLKHEVKEPTAGTIAKYLSTAGVRERMNKKICSSN
jgi:hypothetical protein